MSEKKDEGSDFSRLFNIKTDFKKYLFLINCDFSFILSRIVEVLMLASRI